jgi:hypothetical protein
MKAYTLDIKIILGVLILGITMLGIQLAQAQFDSSSNETGTNDTSSETKITSDLNSISDARSVYETGTMSLPATVKSFIIMIPDEAHHPPEDDKTISPKNPNFLPTTLEALDGTEVAFVHGDPSHTHVEIVRDKDGNVVWETIPVEHPGGSDTKALSSSGSPFSISDKEFANMKGHINISPAKSTGSLTVGGFFVPTKDLDKYKSEFADAGFNVLSNFDFSTESVQKDLSGENTLLIYSTSQPLKAAIEKLLPLVEALPYK